MDWKIESKPETEVYITKRGHIAIKQTDAYQEQVVVIHLEDVERVVAWMQEAKEDVLDDPEAYEGDAPDVSLSTVSPENSN